MVFSSIIFLWALLPVVLVLYYLVPGLRAKNFLLVIASLLFYAWGEPKYVFLMMASVALNWAFGLAVGRWRRPFLLGLCVTANLLLLGYFKYYNFLTGLLNGVFHAAAGGQGLFPAISVTLPVGISFYTFQALSYVVDVYRGDNRPQKSLLKLMLYVSFFPQLIAGPIVKYHDIETQIGERRVTVDSFCYGVKRFLLGLSKKVILANSFAGVVDQVYEYQITDASQPLLWLTGLLYMLQIYFDFSGYSDMAIGLGRMFGFTFQENFRLPYAALSVRDFWRRWHISLSSWFREYVYIPLGGNRKGRARTYLNLALVFFLTGLWHGAGWTFLFWGMYHGFFMILERCFLGKWLDALKWKLPARLYTLVVVYFGWIFFRAESMGQAFSFLRCLFEPHAALLTVNRFMDNQLWTLLFAALFLNGGFQAIWRGMRGRGVAEDGRIGPLSMAGYLALLWISLILLVNNTYNPFIYFRF